MRTSYHSENELQSLGFKKIGRDVRISRLAQFYFPENITIGDRSRIDDFCILSGEGGIDIGCNVHIGAYSRLFGGHGIEMGDFSCTSIQVCLFTEKEDSSVLSMENATVPTEFKAGLHRAKIVVGRHAAIGAHTVLLPGAQLGEGTLIGPLCIVDKPCDPWYLYGGGVDMRRSHPRLRQKVLDAEAAYLKSLEKPFVE